MDQNLLCDEVWPSSPLSTPKNYRTDCGMSSSSFYETSKEDYDEALIICLEKEMSYMPEPNYVKHLSSNNLVIARLKSIRWFIKSRIRLNLSLGTVFYAANYLDRFISMNHCNGWKYWMVELLSIACLSIASKFNDTCTPTLLEIQMEDLDHSFESSTIQRMEMVVLDVLLWRLASTTTYSYLELILPMINLDGLKPQIHEEFITRFNRLLIGAISDSKLLEFRPSLVAIAALSCSLDKSSSSSTLSDTYLACLISLLDHNQKAELVKCQKIMEAQSVVDDDDFLYDLLAHGILHFCPSSPTTVLLKERINLSRHHVDFSLFRIRTSGQDLNIPESSRNPKKRNRDEE